MGFQDFIDQPVGLSAVGGAVHFGAALTSLGFEESVVLFPSRKSFILEHASKMRVNLFHEIKMSSLHRGG